MASELVTGTDSKVWIGPSIGRDIDTLSEFQGLTGWQEVGLVERIGPRGARSGVVTGNVISEGVTRKAKGVRNNGNAQVVVFPDDSDAGQLALRAAEKTNNKFAIKVSPKDRPNPTGTDSIQYYRGLITSAEDSELTSDGLLRTTFDIEIDGQIFRVPAAAGV